MTLGIGLESSRERKGFCGIFFGNISSWLALPEGIRAVFHLRKIQSSSSPFWCHKISKFVLQVNNVSSLDIWGFLRFVLGDLVHFFCEVFSSCDLHLGVFVRLMPFLANAFFSHFVNSFGDSGRN